MDILATITWNIKPEIFPPLGPFDFLGLIFGPLTIRWYGLLFALGFVVGYQIMYWIFVTENKLKLNIEKPKNKKVKAKKKMNDFEALAITMILGTVIGARLGHCLFYEPLAYLSDPIRILKVWEGGLASHGAAIGILTALWLYTRKRTPQITMLWVLDRIVIVIALAGCFIRLGNFFNSEIVGTPSTLPWAVIFLRNDNIPRHPAQLYESLSYLAIFIFLFFRYKKFKWELPDGNMFGLFLILVFGVRFLIEFVKENQSAFEQSLPLDMGQILSIPLIITGIYFIIRARRIKTSISPS